MCFLIILRLLYCIRATKLLSNSKMSRTKIPKAHPYIYITWIGYFLNHHTYEISTSTLIYTFTTQYIYIHTYYKLMFIQNILKSWVYTYIRFIYLNSQSIYIHFAKRFFALHDIIIISCTGKSREFQYFKNSHYICGNSWAKLSCSLHDSNTINYSCMLVAVVICCKLTLWLYTQLALLSYNIVQ